MIKWKQETHKCMDCFVK